MVRLKRKLLLDTLLVGLALTFAVILVDQCRKLTSLERWAYDQRARRFQRFSPPPTDRLVHLDIDDRTLDVVGRWPWPRAKLAEILEEIRIAGPKVVALDVIFSEPQDVDYRPLDPSLGEKGPIQKIDHDALLADAFQRSGNVILPVALLGSDESVTPLDTGMRDEYRHNLQLADVTLVENLRTRGFREAELAEALARQSFLTARRRAAYDVVAAALNSRQPPTLDALAPRLLKNENAEIDQWHSPVTHLLEDAYNAAEASRFISRLAMPIPADAPRLLRVNEIHTTPLARFGEVVAGTAFVDHHFAGDPVVRSSPLVITCGDRAYLQLGLSMACRMLDIDPSKIRLQSDSVTLPLPNGRDIIIPVRTVPSAKSGAVPMVMDIPWAGSPAWQTMYDWPRHQDSRQHISLNKAWDICLARHKIEANNRNADLALSALLADDSGEKLGLDPGAMAHFIAADYPLDDVSPREKLAAHALKQLEESGFEQIYSDLAKAGPLKEDEKAKYENLLAAKAALRPLMVENRKLQKQLTEQRADFARQLKGRAALIGLTPSSSTADIVSTSLHDRSPGVIVHGAIFSAIMTRTFWHFAPQWVTALLTLLLGTITALVTAWLPPARAMATAVILLILYILLNGALLFDRYSIVVGLAAPCVTIVLVWGGCVMLRMVVETRERALITRRFQAYVDPTLVDYVLEHPEEVHLKGQVRELTVVFTDLANFTTLSEALGERSVALLNDYMADMVPIIRSNRGYVNKFLGDGIMCFYGAPRDNTDHAVDAVKTALEMQAAMARFNARHAIEGLPALEVRVGVSTGQMVVGDAGSRDCSDYTVLGDAVNLGSRLESANKQLGTHVLVNARTVAMAGDLFTFCPVGRLLVAGKTEGVDVFEALPPGLHPKMILTTEMVASYQHGDFNACLAACDALDRQVGQTKLTNLYRDRCVTYLQNGIPPDFNGSISLNGK